MRVCEGRRPRAHSDLHLVVEQARDLAAVFVDLRVSEGARRIEPRLPSRKSVRTCMLKWWSEPAPVSITPSNCACPTA